MHGWRAHLGQISPTPIEGWVTREFYEIVPKGIDTTIALLSTRRRATPSADELLELVEHPARLLAERGADAIHLGGVLPVVAQHHGFDRELVAAMEKAGGRQATTDVTAAMEAFRALGLRRLVLSSQFDDAQNETVRRYLAASGFDVLHMRGAPAQTNAPQAATAPDEIEFISTRQAFRECTGDADGVYIPAGGWGTAYNVARLEQDLGKPVVTWQTAMIWWFLRSTGVRAPIRGFGSLMESIGA